MNKNITRKTISVESIDLSDISDKLYEDIMTIIMDEAEISFWKNRLCIYFEWDRKTYKRKWPKISDVAKNKVRYITCKEDTVEINETIFELEKALLILKNKIKEMRNRVEG